MRLLLALFVLFLGGIIYSVNTGSAPTLWEGFYGIPYVDKMGHFLLMGTLSFLVNRSLDCRQLTVGQRPVMVGTLIVLAVVGLEEFSQAFIPTRSCDFADFAADVVGIMLGAFLAKCTQSRSAGWVGRD